MNIFANPQLSFSTATSLSPLTSFSECHLNTSSWLNKTVGVILLFSGISLMATAIKLFAQRWFSNHNPVLPHDQPKQGNLQMPKVAHPSHKVVIVANKTIFMKHETGTKHPESPQRVEAIEQALTDAELMTADNTIKPRQATVEEISLCHDNAYQKELKRQIEDLSQKGIKTLSFNPANSKVANVSGDFQISSESLEVSLYAAGAPLTAIEYLLNPAHQTSRAFCIVRPPGHHAHQKTGSGFCVFNNVAIAAKHLTQNLGFKRVLIVDWDAHHGDGTQELTEEDGKIFYFSTHTDTTSGFYPGPVWGRKEDQGIGKGKGTVLNCPVSGYPDQCRNAILKAFREQLIPAMDQYKPDFVLISCGFDAHQHDSLVGLGLTDDDYREMTGICIGIAEKYAQGRIVSVLEGGYNLDAISSAAKVHVEAMKHPSSDFHSET